MIKSLLTAGLFLLGLFGCGSDSGTNAEEDSAIPEIPGFTLVWNDEFNTDGLPSVANWGYDTGGGGWGNQELQRYTNGIPENVEQSEGTLKIKAILLQRGDTKEYLSTRMVTRGKAAWQFGRIEVRAKLPSGVGTWPAIWMLPTDNVYGGWPNSGEIDIMEHVGFDANVVHGTVHTGAFNGAQGTQRGGQTTIPTALDAFHVYSIDWNADRILFSVDEQIYFRFNNSGKGSDEWPFDQRFHLIMNIAVGGTWGGQRGVDDSGFPAVMEVDYVRVYQKSDS